MAKNFKISDGQQLNNVTLEQGGIFENKDNPELADWTVGIRWFKTFSKEQTIWKTNFIRPTGWRGIHYVLKFVRKQDKTMSYKKS